MLGFSLISGRAAEQGRPPFSLRRKALQVVVTIVLGVLLIALDTAASAPIQGYRLAGTVAVGKDYIAFLEIPGGGQFLVRQGSKVNGAQVVDVSASSLRLALASGVIELSLEGSGKAPAAVASTAIAHSTNDEKNRVYVRDVSADQLSRALGPAGAATPAAKPGPTTAGGDVAAQRIAAVLELPQGSRVLSVSGQKVSSADAAIRSIESTFASGREGVILDLQTAKGPGRVYINKASH